MRTRKTRRTQQSCSNPASHAHDASASVVGQSVLTILSQAETLGSPGCLDLEGTRARHIWHVFRTFFGHFSCRVLLLRRSGKAWKKSRKEPGNSGRKLSSWHLGLSTFKSIFVKGWRLDRLDTCYMIQLYRPTAGFVHRIRACPFLSILHSRMQHKIHKLQIVQGHLLSGDIFGEQDEQVSPIHLSCPVI